MNQKEIRTGYQSTLIMNEIEEKNPSCDRTRESILVAAHVTLQECATRTGPPRGTSLCSAEGFVDDAAAGLRNGKKVVKLKGLFCMEASIK